MSAAVVDIKTIVAASRAAFDAMDKGLGVFNRVLDHVVPWKMYADNVNALENFSMGYSNESSKLVGEVKTHMLNAHDNYRNATQGIVELSGTTAKSLTIFVDLLSKNTSTTYSAERTFLINVLNDGTSKLSDGIVKIDDILNDFNAVAGKLAGLLGQFKIDFDEKSKFFKGKVDAKTKDDKDGKIASELHHKLAEIMNFFVGFEASVTRAIVDVTAIRISLDSDIKSLISLKSQIDVTESAIAQDDVDEYSHSVMQPVYNLIAQCKEYQKRHNGEHVIQN